MKHITLLSIFISISVFAQKIEIPVDSLGISFSEVNSMIYIKKVDYFNSNSDNFLVDSIIIDKNRMIKFNKRIKHAEFYLISTNKNTPRTYIPLRQHPDKYNYTFCGKYYMAFDYLYVADSYNHKETKFLKEFYKKFTENGFDKDLYNNESEYLKLSVEKAEVIVNNKKKLFLSYLEKNKEYFSNAFCEYIETEIKLGAMNQFLNWYEYIFNDEITSTIRNNRTERVLEKFYNFYSAGDWESNSLQFYKSTKRYVNFQLSKKNNEFNVYHVPSEKKNRIAKKYLKQKIYERYLN